MNASLEIEDIVRARAYALWESEGRPLGRDVEHWRLSEEEARRELAAPTAMPVKTKAAPRPKAVKRTKAAA